MRETGELNGLRRPSGDLARQRNDGVILPAIAKDSRYRRRLGSCRVYSRYQIFQFELQGVFPRARGCVGACSDCFVCCNRNEGER